MGVAPDVQQAGIGSRILQAVETFVRDATPAAPAPAAAPPPLLWCNARETAIGFYQRNGWTVESDRFDVPTVGPHVKMLKRLGPPVR
jgi:GNAT superfamily N-acetyltransferase